MRPHTYIVLGKFLNWGICDKEVKHCQKSKICINSQNHLVQVVNCIKNKSCVE